MTDISLDFDELRPHIDAATKGIDPIDAALGDVPAAPDSGEASEIIGLLVAAALDAAGSAADSFRGLLAVAADVVNEFDGHEQEIATGLRDVAIRLEENS